MTVEENIPLAPFTSFHIGGEARYLIRIKKAEDLASAISFAEEQSLPVFVLGGGSNILMSDQGFSGVVIKIEIDGVLFEENESGTGVVVGAGENWDSFVQKTVDRNLSGLENLSAIPGTVGAAPVQNIGAYGVEVKDAIISVEAFNTETKEIETLTRDDCQFAYRFSVFKKPEGKKYIITRVTFFLGKDTPVFLEYKDIQAYMKASNLKTLDGKGLRQAIIEIRGRKLPNWREVGTAGSFFKNPIIPRAEYETLLHKFAHMPHYVVSDEKVKIPAAWLLDNICNFKGAVRGEAGVWRNQALVLVNRGCATAHDIDALAQEMQQCVFNATGISLEREVEYVGTF
jgi:UDP-N-acetylmuramate dehydrogenase